MRVLYACRQELEQWRTTSQNFWPRINKLIDELIKTARLTVSKQGFSKRDISIAFRKHSRSFVMIFWSLNSLQKRGVLVHENSLASCQLCRQSVKPRALTCPFKQGNLNVLSLLSWHPTHTYLWVRLCFVKICCLLSTVTVTPSHDSDYTEALLLTDLA